MLSPRPPKARRYHPHMEALEDRCLLSVSSERFVARLYRDLLQRAVDDSGRTFWSGRIDQGASATDVVSQISASDEFRNADISSLYKTLLNRPGDQAGIQGILTFLGQGHSLDQLKALFLGSLEYLQTRSDGTANGFLNTVYGDVLGRSLDPQGGSFWGGLLSRGISRADVASGIIASAEGAQANVNSIYQQFLHRDADPAGGAHWVSVLQQGGSFTTVIAGIAGSQEYFTLSANTDSFKPVNPPNEFVSDPNGSPLSGPSTATPQYIVRSFLQDHQAEMGLTNTDLQDLITTDTYTDSDTGVTHVYMRQTVGGVSIPIADLNATIDSQGQIMAFTDSLMPDVASRVNETSPTLGILQGMSHIIDQMGMHPSQPMSIVSQQNTPDMQMMISDGGGLTQSGNPARLVYEPMSDGTMHLSWNVSMNMSASTNWWDLTVDAETGQLLRRNNWTDDANYTAFANPLRSPLEGSASSQPDNVGGASPFGWQDLNGVAGDDTTQTNGNNVTAGSDRGGTGKPTRIPSRTATPNTFNFSVDLTKDPSTYQDAASVNLYYDNNYLHDIHAAYGFTEAAGNFQVKNYSGQGKGADSVNALAQFGADTGRFNNNADMSTPPDGQSPTMRMFTFNLTNPQRDGDLDNQVIYHEFGHGVSNRLTGGPANSSALQALQSGGMGEGWSDFWALAFTARTTDKGTDKQPLGNFVLGQSKTGGGIRQFPYSTDLTIDPHTFSDLTKTNEVHDIGEIWTSVLWDLHWNLVGKYGFQSDYMPSTKGNSVALKLVLDGLKLQPVNPTFLQARDAILAADRMDFAGANQDMIWSTFARRGMGFSAIDLNANSNQVTPAFDTPPTQSTTGTVTGVVFNDVNGDKAKGTGEAGIANQTIFLDANQNGKLDTGKATFASGNLALALPDLKTTDSKQTVSGVAGKITKVTVTINLRHTFDNDLVISLISPTGTTVKLVNRVFSSGKNFTATVFDDAAATALSSGSAPFTGTFKPNQALSALNGLTGTGVNGTWTLRVQDAASGDFGVLDNWSFTISNDVSEISTISDAAGSYKLSGLPLTGKDIISIVNSTSFKTITTPTGGTLDAQLTTAKTSAAINFGLK